jgi:Fic family protein
MPLYRLSSELSSQIRRERPRHHVSLEETQRGYLEDTPRLPCFSASFPLAIDAAEEARAGVLRQAKVWQRHAPVPFAERQPTVLTRLLGEFEGKPTARQWAALAKCSPTVAQRDLKDLVDRGILRRNEGGSKNTSYTVALD